MDLATLGSSSSASFSWSEAPISSYEGRRVSATTRLYTLYLVLEAQRHALLPWFSATPCCTSRCP